uniref:F-box domain-containing protein n=1 Tax=Mycena chlorophos TaxID=658473 RepID=A0ABQ0LZQ0_MYCCL|nr:predicted protein [Mycena chlorophos]
MSSSSIVSALAQELLDAVLDFLWDDRRSLLASSLVARNWVAATRHHLFERVVLSLVVHARGVRDTALPFIELCRSPLCTVLPGIRDVLIVVEDAEGEVVKDLVDLLGSSPVRRLSFIDRAKTRQSLAWIVPSFPQLRHFTYNGAEDAFTTDMPALVAAFRHLRSLSLFSADKELNLFIPDAPAPAFIHLTTLRLRFLTDVADAVLGWLLPVGERMRLETLDLVLFFEYHSGWGPVDKLNALLRTQAASLKTFSVQITYGEKNSDIDDWERVANTSMGDIDLSPLTALETLYLAQHHVAALLSTLSSLSSSATRIRSVEIAFKEWLYWYDIPCSCNAAVQVVEFADIMAHRRFRDRLVRFVIRVPAFFGSQGIEELWKYFPTWRDHPGTEILLREEDEVYPEGAVEREDVRKEVFGLMKLEDEEEIVDAMEGFSWDDEDDSD